MDSNDNHTPESGGCVNFALFNVSAIIVLYILSQGIFGGSRHDSSSGWGLSPAVPYLWPILWLPILWIVYPISSAIHSRKVDDKSSSRLFCSIISVLIYCLVATFVRILVGGGRFYFYG